MLDREQTILASAKTGGRKYYFMICDVCFWCTSVFEPHPSKYCGSFFSCPVCQQSRVQATPLASNKVYGLKYSENSRLRESSSRGAGSKV
jgi:hypothetical protein